MDHIVTKIIKDWERKTGLTGSTVARGKTAPETLGDTTVYKIALHLGGMSHEEASAVAENAPKGDDKAAS